MGEFDFDPLQMICVYLGINGDRLCENKTLQDMLIPAVQSHYATFQRKFADQYLRFVRAQRPRRSNELPHRFPQPVYREGYH